MLLRQRRIVKHLYKVTLQERFYDNNSEEFTEWTDLYVVDNLDNTRVNAASFALLEYLNFGGSYCGEN